MPPITMKDLKAIRDDLKARKPATLAEGGDRPLSNREIVRQLAPTLLKMKERGFSTGDLVSLLTKHQVVIKIRDLTRYLREYQVEKTKMAGTTTKAKAASPSTPKPKMARTTNQDAAKHSLAPNTENSADDRNLETTPSPNQADVTA